ncbi:MAG: HNH endonuclease [Clostridia bacterium]|nr:HNH endonuclease [Clostridia bacterium]
MKRIATKQQRIQLAILQDFKCAICGCDILEQKFEVDHIQPFSKRGATCLGNLQALCVECHLEKTRAMDKNGYSTKLLKTKH